MQGFISQGFFFQDKNERFNMRDKSTTFVGRLALFCVVIAVVTLAAPDAAIAQEQDIVTELFEPDEAASGGAWASFVEGWKNITDWRHILPGIP